MKNTARQPIASRIIIIIAAIVALPLVIVAVIAGRALYTLIVENARLISALLIVFIVCLMIALLRMLFAFGRSLEARAKTAEMMMMQNGHLIHVGDVSRVAGRLLEHTLDRHYDVEQIRAGIPPQLSHLHTENHSTPMLPPMSIATIESTPPLLQQSTDLASSIARGWSSADRWFLGIDAQGQPQQAHLSHTGMIAVSGIPGSGKTSSAAWLAAQTAAHGGVLFVADPHAGDPESLSSRIAGFSGAIERLATTADEINKIILQVAMIYDRRCQQPSVQQTPVLLLVDEFMQLMLRQQLSDAAERALVTLSGGGRKKAIYGVLVSQNWSAAAMGPRVTVLRQIVTGALVHKSDDDTARFLLPKTYATAAATLPIGAALWFGSSTPVQIQVPWLSDADALLAARPHAQRSVPNASTSTTAAAANPAGPIAPTTPVSAQPAPPTVPLQMTLQEQILNLLSFRSWLTSTEIAQALQADLKVVRTALTPLERHRLLIRRETSRNVADRFEYAVSQSRSTSAA